MSEKIYVWLWRLYPSHFREAYREAALQLFRDRARHEKGFFPSLRLWLDLLADLGSSVPREYLYVKPALTGISARQGLDGMPSFYVFGGESPRLGALLYGGILSLVIFGSISVVIGHDGNHQALRSWVRPPQPPAAGRSSAFRPLPAQGADGAEQEATASGQPAVAATRRSSGDAKPSGFQSNPLPLEDRSGVPQPQAKPQDASAMIRATVEDVKLDARQRHRVIDGAIANLKEYYVYPDVAQKMAGALRAHEKDGDDDAETDGGAFAELLTRQMRGVSRDMHLVLVYSQAALPEHPMGQTLTREALASYRMAMEQQNCTFEKIQILPHNVGYLKLNSFPHASVCRQKAAAAMASLNGTDAIIFDLRDNTGGFPDMVALIASYLFDHPEYLYNPRENTTKQSWTLSPVPGNRLANKPVYVLTSARTISGAEEFSYDLKMLKRATLVGETTAGSAHSGVFHRIDDHFGMGIPETRPINPFSTADWEGTGVEPDLKVKAVDALETAEKLAESKLQKK